MQRAGISATYYLAIYIPKAVNIPGGAASSVSQSQKQL
jgi:hypothetical protein